MTILLEKVKIMLVKGTFGRSIQINNEVKIVACLNTK